MVTLFDGLLVDFCADHDVDVISKGLRLADFDYELQMAQMNRQLTGVDTLFLPTAPQWSYVSSSPGPGGRHPRRRRHPVPAPGRRGT